MIWRGRGWLSMVLACAGFFIGFSLGHYLPFGRGAEAGGLIVAAVVNWFVGQSINTPLREAGVSWIRHHSIYFIPMQWFSVVILALAIFFLRLGL